MTHAREAKGHLVATLKGVATREDAERLNGIELYIARDRLPATGADEYYHADLIGLAAVNAKDEAIGRVVAIHNFGAGDIIEIAPPHGATMLLPFTNAVVPTVDLAGGRVVIELPAEIEGDNPADADSLGHVARDGADAVSGDVSRSARREPRGQGAGVGAVGTGGARHQGRGY